MLGLAFSLGGCFLNREGVSGASNDAGPSDCPPGTVDLDGNEVNGCECTLSTPDTEVCNNSDDDCDGSVDESIVQACGAAGTCTEGEQTCQGGIFGECVLLRQPAPEVCEGSIDENCDGTVDEGCACAPGGTQPCGNSVGGCTQGVQTCGSDSTWGNCVGATLPAVETCNGQDDDCDGVVDNDLTRNCGESAGICAPGVETCVGGAFGTCEGGVRAQSEICDAAMLDEDCDGQSNEGCECVPGDTEDCGGGSCSGMRTCAADGTWGDCIPTSSGTETCNGLDDDCNGIIDDGAGDCTSDTGCTPAWLNGSAYLFCSANPVSWVDANTTCGNQGNYRLVTINDQAEQDFIAGTTEPDSAQEWWIGLMDEDDDADYEDDEWRSGESEYRNWITSPENPSHSNQCVMLDNNLSSGWDDKGCGGSRAYVCETR